MTSTPITHEQARALAFRHITDPPKAEGYNAPGYDGELVILDDETIERAWGWMFFYTSKEYAETGDFAHALGGNAPRIVERATGRVLVTGTDRDPEVFIARYEATGDPHMQPGREVVVEEADGDARSATVARYLSQQFGVSLVHAKQGLDAVATGVPYQVSTPDAEAGTSLRAFLQQNGFIARQLPECAW